mmetsp:Transcript_5257/g.10861  ORF Transcript_5257/g.10861 Transcript_5257/m.10861 type:complete len:206 (-) Transcript_5257:266-883(-)
MVDHHVPNLCIIDTSTGVLDDGFRVDTRCNRTTGVDFTLQLVNNIGVVGNVTVGTIFGNGSIRHNINFCALSSHSTKGIASLAGIDAAASCVYVWAKSFRRLCTASDIWLACVVWDKSLLLNEFKDTRVASPVATSSHVGCTIQNVLDAQVDLISGCVAGDFDAVAQRREGPVRPAASTVLWNMLIQRMGCVTLSINVAPVPVVR